MSTQKITQTMIRSTALTLVAIMLLAPLSHTGKVQKTYAAYYLESTGQEALGFQEESSIQNTITAEKITELHKKMTELDPAQWKVSQKMAAKSTENIVEWVNNGFDGDPAFVTDPEAYIDEKVDKEVEKFFRQLEQETAMNSQPDNPLLQKFLSSISLVQVAHAMVVKNPNILEAAKRAWENEQKGYILPPQEMGEETINAFRKGDVGKFGAQNILKSLSSDQLPVSRAAEAVNQLDQVVQETAERENRILDWGNGFKSLESCTSDGGGGEQCQITNPGSVISGVLDKALGLGLDSFLASDEINQMVDMTFGRMGELALSMENGLSGLMDLGSLNLNSLMDSFNLDNLNLDLDSVAGRLFDEAIDKVFADDGGNNNNNDEEDEEPELDSSIKDLMEIGEDIEEQYLALLEEAADSGPEELQEKVLDENANGNNLIELSEQNLVQLRSLIEEVEAIQNNSLLSNDRKNEQIVAVMEDFYELQPNLARRSDVQILRNELEQ